MSWREAVERINGNIAPHAEKSAPHRMCDARLGRLHRFRVGAALRYPADRRDARIDEHDLLTGRGVGVKLLVVAMKPLFDLIDEIGCRPIDITQRHVDFKYLLAIAHLG